MSNSLNPYLLSNYSRIAGVILDFMNTQLWASKSGEEKIKRQRRDHGFGRGGAEFILGEKDHCSFEFYYCRK